MSSDNILDEASTSEQTPLLAANAGKSARRSPYSLPARLLQRIVLGGNTAQATGADAPDVVAVFGDLDKPSTPADRAGSQTSVQKPASLPADHSATSNSSWGPPVGMEPRGPNDENVQLFRTAVGICSRAASGRSDDPEAALSLEDSRKQATGMYRRILQEKRAKTLQYNVLSSFVTTGHVVQILVGAALTALGPGAADHTVAITALGATNTVLAGLFALIKGQGLPDRLHKDAVEFRRVQDWIEETDALLVAGVVGRDRKEVGLLVEIAFKQYNAVLASEENNKPENYVRQRLEGAGGGGEEGEEAGTAGEGGGQGGQDGGLGNGHHRSGSESSDNAIVRLNYH